MKKNKYLLFFKMSFLILNNDLKKIKPNLSSESKSIRETFPHILVEKQSEKKDDWFRLVDSPKMIPDLETSICSVSTEEKMYYKKGDLFASAVLFCYNNHLSLTLCPDDILQCFRNIVSNVVNDNPEKYRDVFVYHSGKKELKTYDISLEDFLTNMSTQIDANIQTPLDLESDFSTSTKTTKIISSISKMATFKKYFTYSLELLCGIRSVTLEGTLDDWILLKNKVEKASKIFTEKDNIVNLSKHFLFILDMFILTYKAGKMNMKDNLDNIKIFWSRIANYISYGSGSSRISGWINVLCPGKFYDNFPSSYNILDLSQKTPEYKFGDDIYEKKTLAYAQVTQSTFDSAILECEAELNDNLTLYTLFIKAGHLGFKYENDTVKPILAYVIYKKLKI